MCIFPGQTAMQVAISSNGNLDDKGSPIDNTLIIVELLKKVGSSNKD